MTALADPFAAADAPARPLWLVTLADLALLLVGFLLLVQALGREPAAAALRAGFGDIAPTPTLPVAAARIDGFAPRAAALPHAPTALLAWARDAVRDPRVTLTVTGSGNDTDPATGSAALLAADRARTVAAALVAGGVPPDRLGIATRRGGPRAVTVTLAFDAP